MMSDMPENIWAWKRHPHLSCCELGHDDHWSEDDPYENATKYVRADKYAELEEQNKRLVEAAKAINSGKKGGGFLQARRKLRAALANMEKDDE